MVVIQETQHLRKLEARFKKSNKKPIIIITNAEKTNFEELKLLAGYSSFEEALKKVYLDMLTNLHFGFESPIKVYVRYKKWKSQNKNLRVM